ncbi:uncharacterized protein LOC126210205 isoform X1 [Schistocerca nitens]|uniref:uncharacterized protein LOC126210205 isoform X1 n=1 Tax=Schistocerca nitens TaxID=7011 RepID=UPI00211822CE|nr:uncharacterized protein LOC126210205 isoform X1 [Schistocerca nitens]
MIACVTGRHVVGQLGKPAPVLARHTSHRTLSAHPLLQAVQSSTMGLVPKFSMGCFCCTLKTGSFVTAVFLLVGSCVQVGYYAFLVTHMNPQKMCVRYETIIVTEPPPVRRSYDYDYYDDGIYNPRRGSHRDILRRFGGYDPYPPSEESGKPYGKDAANTTDGGPVNSSYAANTTDATPTNSSYAANTTDATPTNSSYAANTTDATPTNSSYAANTTEATPTNSTQAGSKAGGGRLYWPRNPWRRRGWFGGFWGIPSYPRFHTESRSYQRPCIRDYKPFDADNGVLDFDLRGPFDKSILYFNIGIWVATMAATPLLMAGVYKESATMVTAWLVAEALLLMVATAGTLATATFMFHVIPVQIPIVTLLNMAIHLGINIYYLMVVVNFRRQLTTKEEDEKDNDDKRVEQVIV